ncbi:ABC transporter substrate-binding protein [Clostridium baratii]|uniref:ABC transporter substrate-binding protein n=1 Tax=Clostridium baratii TaxID=1561 RepID=UPI0009A3474C|nr:sugar ABC transporter substrate-binding protein [Clostridium baratii]OPF52439.1 ABC transporter substrate-binding protein [Clostridium baratii]OPF55888.1 ABC transporter substrate-binding protein [Clostridium baratii]OPF56731.1 ABC transporter substrate-binding protein [Clostridium baratii]OPF59730.1 ABC transporter substrate-binding protein [Clostridium baratii]
MKKIYGLILLIFCLNLTSCSVKDTTTLSTNLQGYDEGEELITMWLHVIEETPEGQAYKNSIERFNKAFNGKYYLDAEFVPRNDSGGGYTDKINASVISGGLPDIITVDGPNVSAYAANNIIQPLSELSRSEKDEYLPSIIEQGTVNDKLYAIGVMESSTLFYYNKDILNEVGIKVPSFDDPWTWDELKDVCEKVQKYLDKKDGYALDMSFPAGESTIYFYAPFIWSNGGDFVSTDGLEVNGVFDSKKNVQTISYFKELTDKGYIPKYTISDLFVKGRAAFRFDGAWGITNIRNSYPDINLGIAPYPVGNNWTGQKYTPTGGWAFAATTSCKNIEAATEAIKVLSNSESGIDMYNLTGNLPSTFKAYENIDAFKNDELFKTAYSQLVKYGHPRPKSPVYPQISTSYQQAIEGVLLNNETPEEALYKTMRRIEDKLIRYQN